jgi:NAD(P)-dependent dehydrogenase (short-subunit alcohol dehydrogenase family)
MVDQMLMLDNKVVIITGATSGIGGRTAELFVTEGARVVIAGRREDKGNALARSLGSAARFVGTDVQIEADVCWLIKYTVKEFGRIDCLFNNAGSLPTGAAVTDLKMDEFDKAISVHVRSALCGIKHVSPIMMRQKSGSIINMSSIVGIRAGIGSIAYSTAKAAVRHLTRSAAVELGEYAVRVNSISPGPIVTGIFGKATGLESDAADRDSDKVRSALNEILPQVQPLPRAGTAVDVAHAALFLASDDSSFITGHDLVIDGGRVIGRPASIMRAHRTAFAKAFH